MQQRSKVDGRKRLSTRCTLDGAGELLTIQTLDLYPYDLESEHQYGHIVLVHAIGRCMFRARVYLLIFCGFCWIREAFAVRFDYARIIIHGPIRTVPCSSKRPFVRIRARHLKDIVAIFSCPCGIIDHPPIRLVSDLPSQLANNVNYRLKMFTREVAHYRHCFRSYILLKPVSETIGSTFFYGCKRGKYDIGKYKNMEI